MARISVDDCLTSIPSRFDLTMIASKRARQLARGAEAKLPWDGHKSTVLALKEIASGQVTAAVLKEMDLPVVKPPVPTLDALDTYFDNIS